TPLNAIGLEKDQSSLHRYPRGSSKPRRHLADFWQFYHAEAANLRMRPHFLERLFRRHRIEIQYGDRLAARQLAAHRHLCDVHLMLAENGADEADQPWHVAVRENQHVAVHVRSELIWPKWHQPQKLIAEERPRRRVGFLLRHQFGSQQSAEISLSRTRLLDNFNAALARQQLRVDDVDILRQPKF